MSHSWKLHEVTAVAAHIIGFELETLWGIHGQNPCKVLDACPEF